MQYRKKPVIVEAWRFTNENKDALLNDLREQCASIYPAIRFGEPVLLIPTLEGTMTASVGDYIIKGVNGEVYPCKPDIFAKTYEPVN